jgi:hypothetical protein
MLTRHRVDVNAKNFLGKTPLHMVAENDSSPTLLRYCWNAMKTSIPKIIRTRLPFK